MFEIFDSLISKCGIPRPYGYDFYFKNYIFENVEIANKTLCDVGGGNGIASVYASVELSAKKSIIFDPLAEGSNVLMSNQFKSFLNEFKCKNVVFIEDEIVNYQSNQKFDVMLLHNSINHIGEDLIETLENDPRSLEEYTLRLSRIFSYLKKNGILIISDCSSQNFLGKLGLFNPIAPEIEWHLHKPPEFWVKICESLGFQKLTARWTARRELGFLGKYIFAKKIPSFFLDSHFVITLKKL